MRTFLLVFSATAVLAQPPTFNEASGIVSLEAESGTLLNRTQWWTASTSVPGYSGAGFLSSEPNSGTNYVRGFTGVAPEVQFRVRFTQTGIYHVWVRGYAAGPGDDSIHVGLNGAATKSAAAIAEFPAGAWNWSRDAEGRVRTATLSIPSAGVHTINVWMREDGFRFDKLVLVTNSGFVPSGTGPAESARDVVTPPPSLSLTPSSRSFQTVAGTNPAAQQLSVSFTSGTPAWSASGSASWIQVSPASGAGAGSLNVSINAAGLAAGSYTGSVTVTSPGATNSPATASVNLAVSAPDPPRTEFYVAPTGSASNDGTLARPWDIFTAMAHPPAVKPGATIWVRGGEYGDANTVLHVALVGTSAAPIVVRNYQGERATIKSWMQVGCCDDRISPESGSYVWIWGLEFTSPVTARSAKLPGMDIWAPNAKLIHNVLHDTQQGMGFWKSSVNSEALGNIIYNNGYKGDDRGHGHGIYSQNDSGLKRLTDNIVFNQFGWGLHLYATSNSEVRNYTIEGNIGFNNGILSGERNDNILLAGGASGLSGFTVQHNHFYLTPEAEQGNNQIGWLFSAANLDAVVSDNYFIGGRYSLVSFGWKFLTMVRNHIYSRVTQVWLDTQVNGLGNLTWDDNIYNGASNFLLNGQSRDFNGWKTATGFDINASFSAQPPTGLNAFVRKSRCEEGRGHIVIYNWNAAASADVDVSSILTAGMQYEVRDVQNYYGGPILAGTYAGGSLRIPLNQTVVAQAHGGSVVAPTHTSPKFGVFVVLRPTGGRKIC